MVSAGAQGAGWFMELSQLEVVQMVRELRDIWFYRAEAQDNDQRRAICPPLGDPFAQLAWQGLAQRPFEEARMVALSVIERLTNTGTTESNRAMGVYYSLCALVLVSSSAAAAYPWLYEAVAPT